MFSHRITISGFIKILFENENLKATSEIHACSFLI